MPQDKNPKAVSNNDTLRERAKLVKEAPTGSDWEKVTLNGEELYVRRKAKETPKDTTRTTTPVTTIPTTTTKKDKYTGPPPKDKSKPKPKPKEKEIPTLPTKEEEEEVVMLEKTTSPTPKQTGVFGETRTYRKNVPEASTQYYQAYDFPNEAGDYTIGAVRKYSVGEDVIDVAKSYDAKGNFKPFFTGEKLSKGETQSIITPTSDTVTKANPEFKGSLMMSGVKPTRIAGGGTGQFNQQNIAKVPTALDKQAVGNIMQQYDAVGNPIPTPNVGLQKDEKNLMPLREKEMEVGKMYDIQQNKAKGGKVKAPKVIKKYASGTGVDGLTDQQRNSLFGVTSQGSIQPGVVQIGGGQGQYGTTGNATTSTGATSAQVGAGTDKKEKTQEQKNKEAQLRSGIGSALGGYGTSYLATAPDTGSQDSTTKQAMGAVSGLGAVGGAVSGVYGIIDKPAREEKVKAEEIEVVYDSSGRPTAKLKSEARAKDTAIVGSLLSPSEAISTRSSYEGGWTDVSGKGYTKYLEKKAQEQLDEKIAEEKAYKQQQALANREAGNLEGNIRNLYDFNKATYGADKNLSVQYAAKGGVIGAAKMMYAKGGTIVGKGGPKDDAILTKANKDGIEPGSFIVPAENNENAKGIREALFGNKNKVAKFKKGEETDSDVAVSNGEHLFTPTERKKIINYLGEEILEELAPNAEENNESENEMAMAAKGGLIKRADGSYSKRGLWDNIGDAAGSGKKPTAEMLKQEKKIKAGYYNGGIMPESIASQKRTEEIQDTYKSGGYVVERSSDRKGKTHKVTAPDGTVQYFGDSNLGQHPKDPKRKKAFYARHAENLKNNPLFRAFARETWAEGGTTGNMTDRENMREYKDGGLTKAKAKTMLHEGMAHGKPITEQQRKYFGWVAGGSKQSKAYGGDINGYETGGKVKAPNMKKYDNGTPPSGVDNDKEKIKKYEKELNESKERFERAKSENDQTEMKNQQTNIDILQRLISYINPSLNEEKPIDKKTETTSSTQPTTTTVATETKKTATGTSTTPPTTTTTGTSPKAPTAGVKKGAKVPKSLRFVPKMASESEGEDVVVPDVNKKETDFSSIIPTAEETRRIKEQESLAKIKETPKTSTTPPPTQRKGLADYIGNIDPTAIAAGMQVMEGKKLLDRDKRPVDVSKIDPTWNAAVERAQREASYGYTPEQRAMLEQQRINAINEARFAGRNLAGASAGTAYQQERQAINEGWANALQLKSADQQLRMQKQQYADQAVRDRASFLDMQRRRAFGDAMETYNINQAAGSELVGAGVRNAIGAYRYQKELEAQERAAKIAGAPVYNV